MAHQIMVAICYDFYNLSIFLHETKCINAKTRRTPEDRSREIRA